MKPKKTVKQGTALETADALCSHFARVREFNFVSHNLHQMSDLDLVKEKVLQLLPPVSFGTLMGVCTGYAFKKISKGAAFVSGLGFIALQVCHHETFLVCE